MARSTGILIGLGLAVGAIMALSNKNSKSTGGIATGSPGSPGATGSSGGMPSWMVDRRDDADPDSLSTLTRFNPRGVTMHQMGLSRSANPDRLLGVHAHFVVMRDGRVLWLHDLDQRVANSKYSGTHIQIEVEGNFQSTRGRWWNGDKMGRHLLKPEQATAIRQLLVWLEQQIGRNEQGKLELTSHSMAASPSRRGNDSGPEVWQAANWILNRPLWEVGPVLSEYNGEPIPDNWWTYQAKPPLASA